MRWVALVFFPLPLMGCDQIDNYVSSVIAKQKRADQYAAEIKVNGLQSDLKALQSELNALKVQISGLKTGQQLQQMQIEGTDRSPAEVTDSGGYGIAKTRQGVFLVTIQKLDPYLDGYRATLNIGNPHNLTMHGGEFLISWGLPWNSNGKTYAEISATRRSKTFSVVKDFLPGSYTVIDVALTPAKPEEVKEIMVEITWNRISLRRPANGQ